MNIAMFTDTYTPQINGVVTSIMMSAQELRNRGHKVYIFGPDFDGTEESEGFIYRYPSTGYPMKAIKEFQLTRGFNSLIRKMRELEIDIIHSHDPGSMGLKAVPISRYLKIPHIHTYHTFWPDYVHYFPLKMGNFRYTKNTVENFSTLFCNRCDGIIAPSEKIEEVLIETGTRVPTCIVPTGIAAVKRNIEKRTTILNSLGIDPNKKILSYAGRVVKEKNIPFLLDMLVILKKEQPDTPYHLLLVGDGKERKELEQKASDLGIADHCSFAGFRSHDELMSIFSISDLFVFASVTETQGLVLLEAMASGIPAVVVDALGIGETMKDGKGGFPVPEDPEIFAQTVHQLIANPELYDKKREEALVKAEQYSLSNCTIRLENFYQNTINSHRPSHYRSLSFRRFIKYRNRQKRHGDMIDMAEAMQNLFEEPTSWSNRYFVMRHGQSEANVEGLIVSHFSNGLNDYGLTEKGRQQIQESIEKQNILDENTVIISSDFLRTRETAQEVCRILKTKPPMTNPFLRERSFGNYELREDIYYKVVWKQDEKNDRNSENDVESPEEVQDRFRGLIHMIEEEYQDKTILLIAHGDTLQIAQTWIEGIPPGLHRSLEHLDTAAMRELKPKNQEEL